MSTQVQQAENASQQTNKKSSTIDKALMIQQREQLKQMVLQRLITDHAKGKEKNKKILTDLVNHYFQTQKINDSTLKQLKQQAIEALANNGSEQYSLAKSMERSQAVDNQSVISKQKVELKPPSQPKSQQDARKLEPLNHVPGQNHNHSNPQNKTTGSFRNDDQYSVSSKAPKSVYMMDGDEDDEWATLVKFDTELFKKEIELEKIRQSEFKRKIKQELDKQLEEKKGRKQEDVKDDSAYVNLAEYQRNVYDQREKDKHDNLQKKILTEKLQRDKQVRDEYLRKKLEQKREKELDDLLVRKIKEELELEQHEQQQRRNKERERLLRMMKENEEYRKKALEDARQEKNAETQMQMQYIALQNQLEEQREKEKKEREEKMKRVMGTFAESVVKDQKEIIRQEDEKMLKNILEQNERDRQEEERRRVRQQDQKVHIRQFLSSQIEEKKRRQDEESQLNKRQADIWKQDLDNYNDHEKRKHDYIKEVNLRHAEILKSQMNEKQQRKSKKVYKMNTTELLQNKDKLKVIAETDPAIGPNVKKVEVVVDQPQH